MAYIAREKVAFRVEKKIPEYQREVEFSIWRKKIVNIRVWWGEKKVHWSPAVVMNEVINEAEKTIRYNR